MSPLEQNKEIVQRIFNEFWRAGNTSVLDQLLASDVTNHELSKEPLSGRNAYKEWATGFRQVTATGFPDLDIALDALVAEGDLVAKRWTFRGTHKGDYMGLPATGRRVVRPGSRSTGSRVVKCARPGGTTMHSG
jgi:predicted ester cyclase